MVSKDYQTIAHQRQVRQKSDRHLIRSIVVNFESRCNKLGGSIIHKNRIRDCSRQLINYGRPCRPDLLIGDWSYERSFYYVEKCPENEEQAAKGVNPVTGGSRFKLQHCHMPEWQK